jgi:hypothetical protein
MIEITHTHEDGTLASGTSKGDGAGQILKPYGFRWMPSIGVYGIRGSRDRAARRVAINQAADALRAQGFEVTVTIDDTPRAYEQVKADRHERLEDRRAALEAKGDKLAARADALHRASDAMVEHIPPGQPVLPGKRGRAHRNLLDRSINTAIRAARTAAEAEQMPERIAGSYRREAHQERPDVTARRVARLEAEDRRLVRQLDRLGPVTDDGQRSVWREEMEARRAVIAEQLRGDRELLEQAKAEGRFGKWDRTNVHAGDKVLLRFGWRTVVRANPKTVSVETGYSWTDKHGWEEIRDVRCSHTEG